jgi:hypothetical protein
MRSKFFTVLFFILLIAACATSTDVDETENTTTLEEDIEQEATVEDMIKRDKERIDSMEKVLNAQLENL